MSLADGSFEYEEEDFEEATNKYWPSVADIMSAGALIILLFTLMSFVQGLDFARRSTAIYQRLENVLKIKANIITELKQAIEATVGENNVQIDDKDLTLRIRGEVFFDRGSSQIKPPARPILDQLARAFTRVLEDSRLRSNISAIFIEGHCDERGSAELNWRLSVDRAVQVVEYLHRASPALGKKYPRYFGAAGYSKFRPAVQTQEAAEGKRRTPEQDTGFLDRRIEIRIILRDEALREQIENLLRTIGRDKQ